MNDKLTPKQERFIQNIVSGMTQREAYKNSYNTENMKDETIDKEACLLFNSPKIAERYRELMDKLEDESIMSAKERMKWLTDVVKGKVKNTSYDSNGKSYENEAYISDKLRAIDTLNKMSGEYVNRVEADVNTDVSINIALVDDED